MPGNDSTYHYLTEAKESMVYYTIAEYHKLLREKVGIIQNHWSGRREEYKVCGLLASSLCKKRGFPVKTYPHKSYKRINKYPEKILAEILLGRNYHDLFPDYSTSLDYEFPNPIRISEDK
jgi:hypothetical protein